MTKWGLFHECKDGSVSQTNMKHHINKTNDRYYTITSVDTEKSVCWQNPTSFFKINLFTLIGGQLLYNIVMVSAIQWDESATGVHVSPILNPLPPPPQPHPSVLPQCTGFECLVSCIELGLVIYFICGNTHVSMLFSQIIPPLPSPTEYKSLFFVSVSLLLSHI